MAAEQDWNENNRKVIDEFRRTGGKVSGGTRSADGTETKMTLASLFGTWRALGLNPLEQCRALLAAPQV